MPATQKPTPIQRLQDLAARPIVGPGRREFHMTEQDGREVLLAACEVLELVRTALHQTHHFMQPLLPPDADDRRFDNVAPETTAMNIAGLAEYCQQDYLKYTIEVLRQAATETDADLEQKWLRLVERDGKPEIAEAIQRRERELRDHLAAMTEHRERIGRVA